MLLNRKRSAVPVHHPRTPDYGDLSVEHAYGATLDDARSASTASPHTPTTNRPRRKTTSQRSWNPTAPSGARS